MKILADLLTEFNKPLATNRALKSRSSVPDLDTSLLLRRLFSASVNQSVASSDRSASLLVV